MLKTHPVPPAPLFINRTAIAIFCPLILKRTYGIVLLVCYFKRTDWRVASEIYSSSLVSFH